MMTYPQLCVVCGFIAGAVVMFFPALAAGIHRERERQRLAAILGRDPR